MAKSGLDSARHKWSLGAEMGRFFRVVLRTLDVPAARTFYGAVLGLPDLDVVPLHAQAVARGARAHWLGLLDVGDVDRAVATLVERGATVLGPKWTDPSGTTAATVRDPGGAVIGLAKPPSGGTSTPRHEISWYVLNTANVEAAKGDYQGLAGWEFLEPVEVANIGRFHPFTWQSQGAAVGALADIAGRPGVHPHWLFHFPVPDVAATAQAVSAHGGSVLTIRLPDGELVAVCDDPQGAAFGLRSRRLA